MVFGLLVLILTNKKNIKIEKNIEVNNAGFKVNNSDQINIEKIVDNIKISNTSIVYKEGITSLKAEVKNMRDENLNTTQIKVKFLDSQGVLMKQEVIIVEPIKVGEEGFIKLNVDGDFSNCTDVKYEILR